MKVAIHVTQDDIASGEPGNCRKCPVWLAIARALPWLTGHCVYEDTVTFGSKVNGASDLPGAVTDWIADFDVELPVAPFTFELDVPDDLIPAGVMS